MGLFSRPLARAATDLRFGCPVTLNTRENASKNCGPDAKIAPPAAIARTALKPYQGAEVWCATLNRTTGGRGLRISQNLGQCGRNAPNPAFCDQDTGLGRAALFGAPQGQFRRSRLPPRSDERRLAAPRGCPGVL